MKRMIAILLLLTLSLSMWGCSSSPTSTTQSNQQPNKPNSSASSQYPNNNNSSNNTSSAKIDPNGFSSLESLANFYLTYEVTYTASKSQVWKIYAEKTWEIYEDHYGEGFEQLYSKYLDKKAKQRPSMEACYGTNYSATFEIIDLEENIQELDINEKQQALEIYGIELTKINNCMVTVSITITGELQQITYQIDIPCKKVGNKWYFG